MNPDPEVIQTLAHVSGTLACPTCGYDLRGNVSGRCPECAREISIQDVKAASRPDAGIVARRLLRAGFAGAVTLVLLLAVDLLRAVNGAPRSAFAPTGGRTAVSLGIGLVAVVLAGRCVAGTRQAADRRGVWVWPLVVWILLLGSLGAYWVPG